VQPQASAVRGESGIAIARMIPRPPWVDDGAHTVGSSHHHHQRRDMRVTITPISSRFTGLNATSAMKAGA
jgi:hypothetical protein